MSIMDYDQGFLISIHAPLRGRLMAVFTMPARRRFQSTPPCGGDVFIALGIKPRFISIHAPLRGRPAEKRKRA